MLARLLLVCCSLLVLNGCGGSSSSPPPSPMPIPTELGIYGITDGATVTRDYVSITIDRTSKASFRNYSGFLFIVDKQSQTGNIDNPYSSATYGSFEGKDRKELIIKNLKAGVHTLDVKGIMKPANGVIDKEVGSSFTFNVAYQRDQIGSGRFIGDRTSYTNAGDMKVDFASYSGARSNANLSGGILTLSDALGTVGSYSLDSGSVVSGINSNPSVDFLMTSPLSFLKGYGTGYQHFMQLLLLQGPLSGNADKWGDLRLYRNDSSSHVLSAYCPSLKGNSSLSPEKEGVITLQSLDGVNFFGHLRLWNKNSATVWTYQVAGYANENSKLSSTNNSMSIVLSTSSSPIEDYILRVNPFPALYPIVTPQNAPVPSYPGVLTVVLDNGKFKLNTLSLKLDDIYAANGSIVMKASYAP